MFYDYCNRAEMSDVERLGAVNCFTNGRTDSLKECSEKELRDLERWAKDAEGAKNKAIRGRIIYLLTQLGYKDERGEADWTRINAFVASHGGEGNPKKKVLHKLKYSELRKVVQVVEMYYKSSLKALPQPSQKSPPQPTPKGRELREGGGIL